MQAQPVRGLRVWVTGGSGTMDTELEELFKELELDFRRPPGLEPSPTAPLEAVMNSGNGMVAWADVESCRLPE